MLAIESINNTTLAVQPLSDGYSVTCSDLLADGSGRSAETGAVMRYPIRRNVYKINLKFKGKSADIAQVNALVSEFTQTVKFLHAGEYHTANFYPSDRNMNDKGLIAELSVNLIQL